MNNHAATARVDVLSDEQNLGRWRQEPSLDDKQKKPPFRSCLNKAASDEFIWRYMHNTNLGVMNFYESDKKFLPHHPLLCSEDRARLRGHHGGREAVLGSRPSIDWAGSMACGAPPGG